MGPRERVVHLGDVAGSIEVYRDILDLDPAHAGARMRLEARLGDTSHKLEAAAILEPIYEQLEAWKRLIGALALGGVNVGERRTTAPEPESLTGIVEVVSQDSKQRFVTLRLEAPAPGVAIVGTCGHDNTVSASINLYFYGDNGWATPSSGFDFFRDGSTGGRVRADGSIIARNSFDLPSLHRVDTRLQKQFRLGSNATITGIFEVYNLFNHANYGSFVTNESNPQFGRPTENLNISYQPRMLQFGFRTTF